MKLIYKFTKLILCKLMYFYWKISYLEKVLYTGPGQPGGPDCIGGGGRPCPTLATAINIFILFNINNRKIICSMCNF